MRRATAYLIVLRNCEIIARITIRVMKPTVFPRRLTRTTYFSDIQSAALRRVRSRYKNVHAINSCMPCVILRLHLELRIHALKYSFRKHRVLA